MWPEIEYCAHINTATDKYYSQINYEDVKYVHFLNV